MILEWAAATALAAGAAIYWRRRRTRRAPSPEGSAPPAPTEAPLAVGDVLLLDVDELWLAGALELTEVTRVATLFHTPGARTAWLAWLDEAGRDLALLSPSDRIEAGPVPDELRVDGHRLVLDRRGHARVERRGELPPLEASRARYVVLRSTGGRVAVVVDGEGGDRLALLGRRVEAGRLERLGGREPRSV